MSGDTARADWCLACIAHLPCCLPAFSTCTVLAIYKVARGGLVRVGDGSGIVVTACLMDVTISRLLCAVTKGGLGI